MTFAVEAGKPRSEAHLWWRAIGSSRPPFVMGYRDDVDTVGQLSVHDRERKPLDTQAADFSSGPVRTLQAADLRKAPQQLKRRVDRCQEVLSNSWPLVFVPGHGCGQLVLCSLVDY